METPYGWPVLTHGVGPMRTYDRAILLDLDDPGLCWPCCSRRCSCLTPAREGYVPNVLYFCGGLIHDGTLWLPYGSSDTRVALAAVPLAALFVLLRSPAG